MAQHLHSTAQIKVFFQLSKDKLMTLNSIIFTSIIFVATGGFILVVLSFIVSRSKRRRDFSGEDGVEKANQDFTHVRTEIPALADYSAQVFSLKTEAIAQPIHVPVKRNDRAKYSQRHSLGDVFGSGIRNDYFHLSSKNRIIPRMKVVNDYYWNGQQSLTRFKYTP